MEISKLFYHGDPDSVDNFPLVEIRCYIAFPELCVVWCDYSYLVIVGHQKVIDVSVIADMELFDVFVTSNLISEPSGTLSFFELLLHRSQLTRGHQIHHRTSIELERRIQHACDATPINGMAQSFMTMCEDLASSLMRAEYYQCALASCDRKLGRALRVRHPPRLPPRVHTSSSGRRSILHLPNEILMVIFLRCPVAFPSHELRSPPLSLSQVCSLWRKVTLGMPDLWNRMTLDTALRGYPGYDLATNHTHAYSRVQMAMDTWASRANQQPLHWRLIIDGTLQPTKSFKQAFLHHCSSLRSLDAYFTSFTNINALLGTPILFSDLSSLRISCMENEGDPFTVLDLTTRAPRLTSLSLAFRFCTSRGMHDVNSANVTHLDLLRTAMGCDAVFDMLKRCNNLQEGAFHTYPSEMSSDEPDDRILVQDKLRSLTILANSALMSSFPKIEYPSLERLHYAPTDNPTWSAVPTFHQFRHIHHLTLVDFEIEGSQFLAATLLFTKVKTLVLRFRHASESGLLQRFFSALMDTSHETVYLPKLESLVLQRCKSFPVSEFVSMISRRASACVRALAGEAHGRVAVLKSVVLHFRHHCNAYEALVRLVDDQKIRGILFTLEVDGNKYSRPVSETGVL